MRDGRDKLALYPVGGDSSEQAPGRRWWRLKLTLALFWLFFSALKYDAAKEERYQQEAKQRELQRIEDALQMAARRGESV